MQCARSNMGSSRHLMQVCSQEAGVAASLLECIFAICLKSLKLKPSVEHSMEMHNKICLSGWMHISADPALDTPAHIICVRPSPVDLLHGVSVVCVLYHDVHFAVPHVSVTCVLPLTLFCGFSACCQSHNKMYGIPTQHYSWAKTCWLYSSLDLHLLKFL